MGLTIIGKNKKRNLANYTVIECNELTNPLLRKNNIGF